ncbi:MAG: DinB family protein [Candidatus Hydrogenedentes bacterium]|nr:DinB family protein [Candidatus Hydrogenedentota bacterium]
MIEPMLMELEQEAAATRRLLERVPSEKLGWKPHPKSMSLGQLALHIATIPDAIAKFVQKERLDYGEVHMEQPAAESASQLLPALEDSVKSAKAILGGLDDETAMSTWIFTKGAQTLFSAPRIGVVRTILLNHWYHHRGQLTVYLRLLGVPVPSVYGPSADENPFGM